MIKNLNIHKILNNSKLNYFIILLLGLFIGCYNLLDIRLKASLSRFINYPLILIVIVSTILFIGYYNITLGLLMIVALFIMLYPINLQKNQAQSNETQIESFKNMKRERFNKRYNNHVSDREKTVNKFKNYFRDIFDEAIEDEKQEMDEMIKENLNNKLTYEKNRNNNSKKEKKIKESMTDVINNHTPNKKLNQSKSNSNYQTIKTRHFDPTDDEDTNLLITKEILEDIINRITFEYESKDYLKRYISTRLQEIVKINGLLNLDNDDDDN